MNWSYCSACATMHPRNDAYCLKRRSPPGWSRALRYRVNYGQGQVSETFEDRFRSWDYFSAKRAALKHLAELPEPRGAFIEFQDPDTGDWFPIGVLR